MIDVVSSFLFFIILHKNHTPLSRKPVVIFHSVSKSSRHFFFFFLQNIWQLFEERLFFHEQSKCYALFSNLLDVNVWLMLSPFFIVYHIAQKSYPPLSRKPIVILYSVSKSSRHFLFFLQSIWQLFEESLFFHEQSKCYALFSNLPDVNVWLMLSPLFYFLSYCTKVVPLFHVNQ